MKGKIDSKGICAMFKGEKGNNDAVPLDDMPFSSYRHGD